ncbi:MAG: glycosyltransferase family 39 protein, partial [Syntrophales bacterium LBB04]|nr:glycosyltransferase family 39 protein [Syntrophales bacterium LBB04]
MKKSRGKHPTPRPGRSRKELPETGVIITFLNNTRTILLEENKGRTVSIFIIAFAVILCLLPFSNKAFNIDDPLFIWTATQIQTHPGDFYGFRVNWYLTEMPVYEIQKNPPLVSYYIALIMNLFGSAEIVLHIAFLLPSIATALGIYSLARRFCSQPLLATLISIMTPAFLVSWTTIMCHVIMLRIWIW